MNSKISLSNGVPLYESLRPKCLDDLVGQPEIVDKDGLFIAALKSGSLPSALFWGPPGTGKTSFAKILAKEKGFCFVELSGVTNGVKDVRDALKKAEKNRTNHLKTIIFLDEVHRFSKAQQDIFLPHLESGLIIFIGATTENPSFHINSALRSRTQVLIFKSLEKKSLDILFDRALESLGVPTDRFEDNARDLIINIAEGDARRLLISIESLLLANQVNGKNTISLADIKKNMSYVNKNFDKFGDEFYYQISAMQKSIRGSDPDASIYWFLRMINAGASPLYIARRLVRISCEDVGLADPRALRISLDAWEAYEKLGSPEGDLAIAQAVIFLAVAPKSNSIYESYKNAKDFTEMSPSYSVPLHLRNEVSCLDKERGFGVGYHYSHNSQEGSFINQNYFPEELEKECLNFYIPKEHGLEIKIKEKLEKMREKKREKV